MIMENIVLSSLGLVRDNNLKFVTAYLLLLLFYFFLWRCDPTRVMASSFLTFLDHTQQRNIVGRTPLDE